MNIAIIYHSADFDGRLSNEVCRHWLPQLYPGATLHSYGWDYGQPLPALPPGESWSAFDLIYIVDLSVPELMESKALRDRVVWIDHHKSAMDKYDFTFTTEAGSTPSFKGYRIDGVAACRLCWQWFLACIAGGSSGMVAARPEKHEYGVLLEDGTRTPLTVVEPRLILLAGRYDIWDKAEGVEDTLQHGMRATTDPDDWDMFIYSQLNEHGDSAIYLEQCLQLGMVIEEYVTDQNASIITGQGYTIRWNGLTFLCCNNARYNSLLFTAGVRPEHDALLGWKFDGRQITVSLYHAPGKEHHDLSQIAVKYGGGGHRGACGFKLRFQELAHILPQEFLHQ